ncbi:MAG: TatD family hydrolase [Halodesulfurarchaeum sp.]
MPALGTPVLDNHLHLDRRNGKGIDAVREFARVGGTHLLVVNKPSWYLGVDVETPGDFRAVFEETIDIVEVASEVLRGRAWPVLGVHPALISQLVDERDVSVEDARSLMIGGLEVAAEYAAEGPAVAIKSGRPHYDVPEAVANASNEIIRRALELAADVGVPLQLHTEQTTDLTAVAEWAEDAGLPPEQVVKHYSNGRLAGATPSVMSEKDYLTRAVGADEPFLMETDFVDDPDRPGAVLGPKTVPRRVEWMIESGHEDAVRRAHVETPMSVYGIDTQGTLSES